MNIYRKFEKTFVLLLAVVILCFVKASIAAENTVPVAPAEVKQPTTTPLQTTPPPVITPRPPVCSRN